ncbi:MAG: penicillin-binding protein 2, partial [Lachnospiraceae bacterium]|nr:penicillin-binding protein 2 [Lachnospiraceae bacterium]
MQEKLAVTVIVITLALFALMYVLYRIVDDNKDSYNQIVLSQQEYDSRVIPFRRGDIVDRNGTVLATTEKVYNLILDPRQIMSDQENFLEPTISALVTVFGYDAQTIRSLIQDNAGIQYIRHARQLSYDDKEAFQELQTQVNQDNAKSGSKARVKGVWFEDEYRRIYPNNSLACNVIGFATGDGAGGNGGIEQ